MSDSLFQDGTYFIGRHERRHGARLGPDHRRRDHREINIWLSNPTVSTRHAEINVLNGRIYLRDLGSTNGTFLVARGRRTPFTEGYVQLDQRIALGEYTTLVRDLLNQV